MLNVLCALWRGWIALFRSWLHTALYIAALEQQLGTLKEQRKPRLSFLDRAFWIALCRWWPRWREALVVVRPDTVILWHRRGFRLW